MQDTLIQMLPGGDLFPLGILSLGVLLLAGFAVGVLVARRRRDDDARLRKLSVAVEASGSAIVITDTKGVIEYVNKKFEDLTGYARAEVIGGNPNVLKSGDTPDDEYRKLWQTISAGEAWQGVFHNRRKDGTLFW